MNKIIKLLSLSFLINNIYALENKAHRSNVSCCDISYYLRCEGGPSFSRCSAVCADPIFWDASEDGYNSKLGTAPMVGLETGINFYDILSLGARANYRSKFSYCKFQTSQAVNTPNFLGDKTRFFDLDNTSFMVNLIINRTKDSYGYSSSSCAITPYGGLGVGFARSTLYNFHSTLTSTVSVGSFTTNRVNSIMGLNANNSFAWDAQAGVNFSFCDSLSVSIAYRYFDSGNFKSNNYITNIPTDFDSPIETPAWTGKLKTNELVIQAGFEW